MQYLALLKRVPAVVWLVLAGLLLVAGFEYRIHSLEQEVTQSAFDKDSIEAFNARTVLKVAGQRRLATRRVIQTELANDSLNKALATVSRVKSQTTVVVDTVHGTDVASVLPDTSFKFNQYAIPYTLAATVKVQPDGTTAKLDWTVKQDAFRIGARVDCSEVDTHGVHAAYLTLDLPKYMTATVDSVSQSREVCSGDAHVANTGVGRIRAYAEAGTIVGGILVATKVIHWLVGK